MTYNIEQHLDKSHGKYEAPGAAPQLTLEQTLLRGQQQVARAQLSAADAANRFAVTNGVPAEQIVEPNALLPLFRVVQSIRSSLF